jgi:hypothetical protein
MVIAETPRQIRRAVLLNDTSVSNHYGCSVVMEQIRARCIEYAFQITAMVPLRGNWRLPEHRTKIDDADLVLVNAEGSVHGSREFARELLSVADYCSSRGIPAVFFNGVYQNNDAGMDGLMHQFKLVFVRESRSQAELDRSGIMAKVVPDMFFGHKPRVAEPGLKLIDCLVTDSISSEVTAASLRMASAMPRTNFVTMRMGPVNRALTVRNFLGFQLQKRYFRQTSSVRIYGWGPEAHCRTMNDLETLVRASRLVVTGRFHMACLCLLLNTPLIALPSNSHKMEGMLEDLGLAHRMMRPDEVTSGEMDKLSIWTDSESQAVTRYVREANSSINQMFREVRKLVDS